MAETNGSGRQILVRDGANTVEVFVPEQALRDLVAERDRLRRQVASLQGEVGLLRQERDEVQHERDIYLKSLHHLLGSQVTPMTEEELHDLKTKGISEEEFRREIDRLFPAHESEA